MYVLIHPTTISIPASAGIGNGFVQAHTNHGPTHRDAETSVEAIAAHYPKETE